MFRRAFTVAGVSIAALALMVGRTPMVHAETDNPLISDAIVFTGHATITSDSDGDTPAAVELAGGSGSYTFSNGSVPAVCYSDLTEEGTCSISSSGTFTNTVCGTGSATGTAGATTVTSTHDTGSVAYGITFVATVGVLTGTWSSTDASEGQATPDSEPLHGVVLITAPVGVPQVLDTGDCTDAFTVVGAGVALELGSSGS